jgi:hypothetical protein
MATAACDHATLVLIVAKALGCLQPSRTGRLEVFRGDGGRYGRRVCALDVGGIGRPSCGAEANLVEDAGVDVDQPLAYAVLDRREVGGAQLVQDEAADVSFSFGRSASASASAQERGRGSLFILEERHGRSAVVASYHVMHCIRFEAKCESPGQLKGYLEVEGATVRGVGCWTLVASRADIGNGDRPRMT